MSDGVGEGKRHPAAAVEVGAVPSKISPVVAYIVSTAAWIRRCTEVTPVASNGGVHTRDADRPILGGRCPCLVSGRGFNFRIKCDLSVQCCLELVLNINFVGSPSIIVYTGSVAF